MHFFEIRQGYLQNYACQAAIASATWVRDCVTACLSRRFLGLVFDFEIVQQDFVVVLGGEAGVAEITVGVTPVLDAAIVIETQVLGDDKRYVRALQALPEE